MFDDDAALALEEIKPYAKSKSDCKLIPHDPNWHIELG
jgi:hypothetical protein